MSYIIVPRNSLIVDFRKTVRHVSIQNGVFTQKRTEVHLDLAHFVMVYKHKYSEKK